MSGQEAAGSRKWHAEQEMLYAEHLSKLRFKPIGGDSDGRGMNESPELRKCHGHAWIHFRTWPMHRREPKQSCTACFGVFIAR
jgi:hypothetical protein